VWEGPRVGTRGKARHLEKPNEVYAKLVNRNHTKTIGLHLRHLIGGGAFDPINLAK
jgi:hypothetical protein